ncbi:hypothetical protein JZU68_07780 [bacterium]|nr:hypothetical protein [bacterium]
MIPYFINPSENTSVKEFHYKEDTSKPENRVNLTLFHLLMNDGVKEYIFRKLELDTYCVVYPAPNLVTEEFDIGDRPDFKIEKDGKLVGYIEVELGKDIAQINKYNQKTADHIRIYSIFGKPSDGGDLSLEEIYYYLKENQGTIIRGAQDYWSLRLLLKLIEYYVIEGNFKSNNKRASISESMRNSSMITALYEGVGSQNILDQESDKPEKGKLILNTVGEGGFSLRVYARNSKTASFSLMWRSGGRETIYFPAHIKMVKYVSNKQFVERYANLLISLGCTDIMDISERQSTSLNIKTVEANMDKLIDCMMLLIH